MKRRRRWAVAKRRASSSVVGVSRRRAEQEQGKREKFFSRPQPHETSQAISHQPLPQHTRRGLQKNEKGVRHTRARQNSFGRASQRAGGSGQLTIHFISFLPPPFAVNAVVTGWVGVADGAMFFRYSVANVEVFFPWEWAAASESASSMLARLWLSKLLER